MITLSVLGKEYKIEFRHLIRDGKRAQLGNNCPIRGVTTAAVIGDGFIVMDTAVCFDADNFSREAGRNRALWKALNHAPLKTVSSVFMSKYINSRRKEECALNHRGTTQVMSLEHRKELIRAGEAVRAARVAKRLKSGA